MSKVTAIIRKGAKGKGPSVEFRTEGVPGIDCRTASKPYLDAMPGQIIEDQPTEEINQATVTESSHLNA